MELEMKWEQALETLKSTYNIDQKRQPEKVVLLERLLEICRQISTLDHDQVLTLILHHVVALTGARHGALLLVDGDGVLQPKRTVNLATHELDRFEFSRSVVNRAFHTGKVVLLADVSQSEFFDRASVHKLSLKAVAAMPLITRTGCLGVIYLDSDRCHHLMREIEIPILEAFAAQAAIALNNAKIHTSLERDHLLAKRGLQESFQFGDLIYRSEAMHQIRRKIERVLDTGATVLLLGETGTGKELVARAIHSNSKRRKEPFVVQNCGALPDPLLESELFGHVRGSFSGAVAHKKGLLEAAHMGTCFLDEIGDASAAMQVSLLRFLESGSLRRVGDNRERFSDVRIVAATHIDLQEAVSQGRFREDLYYRLAVYPVILPPLRQRREDIPALVRHFVTEFNQNLEKKITAVPASTMAALCSPQRQWRGNIRELKNTVYRMMLHSSDHELAIPPEDVTASESHAHPETGPVKTMAQMERDHILKTLAIAGGNQVRAAELLGLKRGTFRGRLKRLAVRLPEDLAGYL